MALIPLVEVAPMLADRINKSLTALLVLERAMHDDHWGNWTMRCDGNECLVHLSIGMDEVSFVGDFPAGITSPVYLCWNGDEMLCFTPEGGEARCVLTLRPTIAA